MLNYKMTNHSDYMQVAGYLHLEFLNYIHTLQLSVWYRDAIPVTAKM
jgi:hypothetical protein